MAKIKDGIFGKIGNIVVAHWKGKPYIRSRPSGNPSNTKAQQNQRSKFGMVVKFVGRILPVINAGFKWRIDEMTERNAAISYIMKNAVAGEKPDLRIDYSSVLVARGNLPSPQEPTVKRKDKELVFGWNFQGSRGSDRVLALAYCPDAKKGVWIINGHRRDDEQLILPLPEELQEHALETYLAFASNDGEEASDSVYLGKI